MTNNTTISIDPGKDVTYELMIEQHGGYDNAKKAYNDMREAINQVPSKHSLENKSQELKAALLAYRRANNIFEMDDYIIHDGELKVFAMWSTAIDGCAYIGYAYAEDGEMAKNDEFHHATDEEIAAGRRLDQ